MSQRQRDKTMTPREIVALIDVLQDQLAVIRQWATRLEEDPTSETKEEVTGP